MIDALISTLILGGTFFIVAGSIGLVRLWDVYSRMHAPTKTATLGLGGVIAASILHSFASSGSASIKQLLAIVFVFLTAPVGAHMIARSAYRSGVALCQQCVVDELRQTSADQESAR